MSKIPPSMWEDPAAFEPDEAEQREAEEATEPAPADDGVLKRLATDDDHEVDADAEANASGDS